MQELMAFRAFRAERAEWAEWTQPSAGLPTLVWSLLLAAAAAAGYLVQRYTSLPTVAGYSVVGALAGLCGFADVGWPLHGNALFLLELGIAVVLFEAGARISLRWFRHNPMVLVQSLAETVVTFGAVYWVLRQFGIDAAAAEPLAVVAVAASPAVLSRVVMDTRAAGPATERALALSTMNTLYALTLGSAVAGLVDAPRSTLMETVYPAATVLGLSFVVAALLGLAMRQLGTAASMLTMLMLVLVSTVAATAPWSRAVAGIVLALVAARALSKIIGLRLASFGSGMRLSQAL